MILCCGEALIDMIPEPTLSGASGFVPHSGGAVFNTAIALGRLGVATGMATALSHDMFGARLLSDLTASQVDTSHVIRSRHPSTLAFVELVNGQARYAFFDENSAERRMQSSDLPSLSAAVTALYVGGISLAREPGGAVYADLVARECPTRVVMLDPNIRPAFVDDDARFRARIDALIGCVDIIKVSDEDLVWLRPGPGTLDDKIAWLRSAGPGVVIVTRGADGATVWRPDGTHADVQSPRVDVVDTVGAGDTFNAGVLAHLHETGVLTKAGLREVSTDDLAAALAFGARVAAVTVSRAGANPPWRQDLA